MLRKVFTFALVSVLASAAALAQTPAQQRRDSLTHTWLERQINGQALIRLRGGWGTAYVSQPWLIGETLKYATATSARPGLPRPVILDAVHRVDVRMSSAVTGAAVGAGIGFLGGLAVGLGTAPSWCDSPVNPCSRSAAGVALVTLASIASGALAGTLIGAVVNKKWKTVYRAP